MLPLELFWVETLLTLIINSNRPNFLHLCKGVMNSEIIYFECNIYFFICYLLILRAAVFF